MPRTGAARPWRARRPSRTAAFILVPVGGKVTTTEEFTRGGDDYVVTCTISNISRSRGSGSQPWLEAYQPGSFPGDGLDDLYHRGGPGEANDMVIGIKNVHDGNTVSFDVDCSATVERDGVVSRERAATPRCPPSPRDWRAGSPAAP